MSIRLLVAPPATGKTGACIERIRRELRSRPLTTVWAVLPDRVQTQYFRRRLAEAGGAIGARVGTFGDVYGAVLDATGRPVPVVSATVRRQVVRAAIDDVLAAGEMAHYTPIARTPGFVSEVASRIAEIKRERLEPTTFLAEVSDHAPLTDLGRVYAAYQHRLQSLDWADQEGLSWLAVAALERDPTLAAHWSLVVFDGFDDFVNAQRDFLSALEQTAEEVLVTLPGRPDTARRAHRRFEHALVKAGRKLDARIETLDRVPALPPAAAQLERALFEPAARRIKLTPDLSLLEARAPADEAREALRWLKARHVRDGIRLDRMAIITPEPERYRPFLREMATEMGVPLRFTQGEALATAPPIAALLDLLALPLLRFPRRLTVEAVRSPYFNLAAFGLDRRDADALETVSRAGRVIGGRDQWAEALDRLAGRDPSLGIRDEDDARRRALPFGDSAARLRDNLNEFAERLAPRGVAPEPRRMTEWVLWLEDLLDDLAFPHTSQHDRSEAHEPRPADASLEPAHGVGGAPNAGDGADHDPTPSTQLDDLEQRDRAALLHLREILRALALEEELGVDQDLDLGGFLAEITGALQFAAFVEPAHEAAQSILVLRVLESRGPRFDAVALVGLSEGIFPQVEREDPFLDEGVRNELGLERRLEREQRGLFYLAVTRADKQLLLTRPYLATDGRSWEPSPYWRETCRLFEETAGASANRHGPDPSEGAPGIACVRGDAPRPVADAASLTELLVWSVRRRRLPPAAAVSVGVRWEALRHARDVLAAREAIRPNGPHEGAMPELGNLLRDVYGPDHVWSPSRLEVYGSCPLRFYIETVLGLEADAVPVPGMDAKQLGSLLHSILEHSYNQAEDPSDPESVVRALGPIADEEFSAAPLQYGFRPTALWDIEQVDFRGWLEDTVLALAELEAGWTPIMAEAKFGLEDHPPLSVETVSGPVLVRGLIDRIDANGQGQTRVVDYKTGSTHLARADLVVGLRLQLPLYAMAAREVLDQGNPVDGLYWSIRACKPGGLRLSRFKHVDDDGEHIGPEGAMVVAAGHVGRIVAGVRAGRFAPEPARGECPSYCAAAAWCWRFRPRQW